jgi:uncharacterized repeat protein (TIGR01451 family)
MFSKRSQLNGLIALLTLSLASAAGALGTTAGSTISNTGFVDYTTDDGVSATATSTAVSATVLQVYAVNISPDGTAAAPGQTVYTGNTTAAQITALTYTLRNDGNGTDNFTLTAPAVSSSVTTAGGTVSYYVDAAGGTAGVYDPGVDTLVSGNISLTADATKTFYTVYTVPANTVGGTAFDITPGAVSVGDATKTDANNLGRIIQKTLYSLSFAAPAASNVTTPGVATYTQTLTNTGNTPLTAAQIALSGTPVDTVAAGGLFTITYKVTYNGVTPATSSATPQAALLAAMGASTLAASGVTSTATLTTTVTANNLLASGNTDVLTLSAAVTGIVNSASVNNNTATAITLADTTTVIKGAGSVTKTQALCGLSGSTAPASCPVSSGAATTAISVKPGDYVVYYISATNSGTGNILGTKVRDVLPAGVSIHSLAAASTQAGTVLYSINGTAWTPTPGTLTVVNAATVYAAVDTNADGTITAADTVATNKTVLFRIKVKVNDGGTVNTVPQTDAQTVN